MPEKKHEYAFIFGNCVSEQHRITFFSLGNSTSHAMVEMNYVQLSELFHVGIYL